MPKKFLLGALLVTVLSAGTTSHAATDSMIDVLYPCQIVDGAVTLTKDSMPSRCDFTPDTYSLTLYQVGLCASAPTAPTPTTAARLGACTMIYNNPAGSAVSLLSSGAPVTLSGGTLTVPPGGTYGYGYILVDTILSISTSVTFTEDKTGQVDSSGRTCWTVEQTVVHSAELTGTSRCGNTIVGSVGTQTVRFDTMTREGNDIFYYSVISAIPESGDSFAAYLLAPDSGVSPQTGDEVTVNRILEIVAFALPVTVPAQPTNVDIGFRTSGGAQVLVTGDDIVRFEQGPIVIKITAQ